MKSLFDILYGGNNYPVDVGDIYDWYGAIWIVTAVIKETQNHTIVNMRKEDTAEISEGFSLGISNYRFIKRAKQDR